MGGLVLAKVRYDHYLRFALPFVAMVTVVVRVPRARRGARLTMATRNFQERNPCQ